jgi:hypothetical protein
MIREMIGRLGGKKAPVLPNHHRVLLDITGKGHDGATLEEGRALIE